MPEAFFWSQFPKADRAEIKTKLANSAPDWLSSVPFYDIDLTATVNWSSGDSSIMSITNDDIQTNIDIPNHIFGVYSRGRMITASTGNTQATLSAGKFNSALTGSAPVSPAEYNQMMTDNTLAIGSRSLDESQWRYFLCCANKHSTALRHV